MEQPISVAALIPAFNEASRIRTVVERAAEHLPVVVVDDGSSDGTAVQAEAAGATILRQRPNRGKGAALRRGFRHALDEGADAVVTLDADGQHDPSEIPRFLDALAAQPAPDLVIGRRNFRTMPPSRRLANEVGRRAFSWAVGHDVPDNQSGYRLVSRRLMETMLTSTESGFEFEVEMITAALRRGWPVTWVPIRTIYGPPSHIRPLHHLRHFARATLLARREMRRG
ncbi:MAG TPA: glycosyltransferase family 2 protein [Vitreimonas sp.]|nr:glycosyltransferase family 2 protein [Vitreimonas sp.]